MVDGRNIQDNALSEAENLMTTNPDPTTLCAMGEPALLGSIAAVESQGKRNSVEVFGWDLTAQAIKGIDAAYLVAVVQRDPTKVIIGMTHLPALPGAPAYEGAPIDALTSQTLHEASSLKAVGVDGLIVENHGDIPFAKPEQLGLETAACMAVIAAAIRADVSLPMGVNVLRMPRTTRSRSPRLSVRPSSE